jgi:hypothetical protein
MDKSTLSSLVESLEALPRSNPPFVGIDDTGEVFALKANPEGLVALATALLKAVQQNQANAQQPLIIPLDVDGSSLDGTSLFLPDYIELTDTLPSVAPSSPSSQWRNWMSQVGCLLAVAFLIVSLVVGAITMVKWLF